MYNNITQKNCFKQILRATLILFIALVGFTSLNAQSIIYQTSSTGNTGVNISSTGNGPATNMGDNITVAGTNRLITKVVVSVFTLASTSPFSLTMSMYTDCSTSGATGPCGSGSGTLLPNSTVTVSGITPTALGTTVLVTFNFPTPVNISGETDNTINVSINASRDDVYWVLDESVLIGSQPAGEPANSYVTRCGSIAGNNGCARDFGIKNNFNMEVTATAAPCTGTPAPGNTISSIASACPATPFTLSLQNATIGSLVTYQFQSGPTATGPFTNIIGATNSTYIVANQTVATFYRVIVTCSGSSGTSTPVQVALTPSAGCYCAAGATSVNPTFEKIDSVNFAGIKRGSTSPLGYESFLTDTAKVVPQGTYPINITSGLSYSGDKVFVWIDFNQNGSFTDPGELVYTSATQAGPYTGNITIPASALLGNTRMRIRIVDTGFGTVNTTPCGNSTYGQVEDYTVNITPCVPVTITSQPVSKSVTCGATTYFRVKTTGSVPTYQWQYKTTTSAWLNVPNSAPYSNVTSDSLIIAPADATLNGNKYRVLVTGACSASSLSDSAILTVTPLIAVVSPASSTICAGSVQQLTLTNTLGSVIGLNEGFNAGVPATWTTKNNSNPLGSTPTWAQGNPADFAANSGAPNSYVSSNYNTAAQNGNPNTLSNWLITPQLTGIKNGDQLTFFSRIPTGTEYPDRLEVRLSINGASVNVGATATSVGDFTNLLLTINPTLTTGVYPKAWTKFTATVTGVTGMVSGRFAFRHFDTDDGTGTNENVIGLDDVVFTSLGNPALGVFTSTAAGTIFTDAAATMPYVAGTPVASVYVKPTVTSTYTVSYTTPGGCVSSPTNVVVTVKSLPTAAAAVANQSSCPGGTVKFISSFTGGVGFARNWQVSTNNGTTYTNLANGGQYSGIATDTLTITAVTVGMNGYKYRDSVSASPCAGAGIISTAGTLTVFPTPVVTLSSTGTALFPGLKTNLSVTVSPNAAATYMFFKNGVLIPGTVGNTLTGLTVDDLGTYSVKVTDINGCTGTSNSITLRDSANSRLFIYPSPNNGQFQIRFYNDPAGAAFGTARSVVIFDSKGARIYSQVYSMVGPYVNMQVDLSNHGKGVYHIDVVDSRGNRLKTGSVLVL